MSVTSSKPEMQSDFQEFDVPVARPQKSGAFRAVESVGLGLTVLALLLSVTIVGTAGDTLGVYNKTTLGSGFPIALWPRDFDLRPTVALVTCGTIIMLSSITFLIATKVPAIKKINLLSTGISYLSPTVSLVVSLVATSFFYGVNASETNHSLQSWSCQWASIDMDVQPHWSTLCKESKTALYLTVVIIPLQVIVLGTVAWSALAQKKQIAGYERKGSPALS
ncbi:uncharacterized protein RSE6_11431 [Rhynchosporium secalis]|uniref:Uncharacterized protein n=1 Tax=Rhynchosporium secalis TaxID=38038 RepID=A0A1E1MMY3_RHYSE|nr:uncharacterized protein RSE6_11431 [Rhynchosporium secalis]